MIIFLLALMVTCMNNAQLISLKKLPHPFTYDLGIKVISSSQEHAPVTICCHGYGHNNQIVNVIKSHGDLQHHLISFNFPDHDINSSSDHGKATFGSINEILPLLYILKRCVIDLKLPSINLYGFSAGGGAIINALAVLNQGTYSSQLTAIGITDQYRHQIVKAIEAGIIILDCPLKSMDEIVDFRGWSPSFGVVAAQYTKNNMRPIDAVQLLQGLSLNLFLYFEKPDEILSNRDDQLFIERLQATNLGKTTVTIGFNGGHNAYHTALWKRINAGIDAVRGELVESIRTEKGT